ncbi:MAG: hypothetical protein JXA21_24455 [Anaerolineae bacterium]|nr:hypothetical protein [Anaerolineae bacterium]
MKIRVWCVALLLGIFAAGCAATGRAAPVNQRQPSRSPDGQYVLTVPVAGNAAGHETWQVTISDPDGNELYRDVDSEFVGNLNVYWIWDDANRVWLYSSDTGAVYYWEMQNGNWVKTKWGCDELCRADTPTPPDELYPEYAGSKK